MDQRELYGDTQAALRAALDGLQARLWTQLPGIIESFDAEKMTAKVRPAIQGVQQLQDGTYKAVNLPFLLDCPVMLQGGGGFIITCPIAQGDECVVFFAARCIDAWWQSGAAQASQPQSELRMHNLSDGFVFVGPFSQPNVIANYAANAVVIRKKDGTAFISLDTDGVAVIEAPGGATINADTTINGNTVMNGDLQVNGEIAATGNIHSDLDISADGDVTAGADVNAGGNVNAVNVNASGTVTGTTDVVGGGKSLAAHIHSGVTTGGGNSGPPV